MTDLGNVENGKPTLVNGDIVFFNSLRHKSGQIWLTGDNRTGAGDGDDEQIIVKLNSIDPKYEKLSLLFRSTTAKITAALWKSAKCIYPGGRRKNVEMARFDLSGGVAFNGQRSMVFAELVRESSGWKLNAIGEPPPIRS
ncbi:tellurium resistance protein TerX [Klebsiella pneumoniae]|nr:tellurium resistance protein TerX [Klebsiella pneumoniae]